MIAIQHEFVQGFGYRARPRALIGSDSTEHDPKRRFIDPHSGSRETPIARIVRKLLIQGGPEHHVAKIINEAPIVPGIAAFSR